MNTLKKVAKKLNISESKASKIKQKIELNEYPNIPTHMIWGTGKKKKYRLELFKKYF